MGLTISYLLKLDSPSVEIAKEKIAALHEVALSLPFVEVSELVEFQGKDCKFNRDDEDDPYRWIKLHASHYVSVGEHYYTVDAERAIAFSVWPGAGCEFAVFGLAVFPQEIEILPEDSASEEPTIIQTNLPPWYWGSFCKTQYASNPEYGGVEHFLKCHRLVIQMLDAAQELGILQEVFDEGDYWQTRDVQVLAEALSRYNSLIAAFVGGMGNILSDAGIESTASIKEYPNFEYLEAEGQELFKRQEGNSAN